MENQSETNQGEEILIGRGLSKVQLNLIEVQEKLWAIEIKVQHEDEKLKILKKVIEDEQEAVKDIDKEIAKILNNKQTNRQRECYFREKLQVIKGDKQRATQKLQVKLSRAQRLEKKLNNLIKEQKKLEKKYENKIRISDKVDEKNRNRSAKVCLLTEEGRQKWEKDKEDRKKAYAKMDKDNKDKLLRKNREYKLKNPQINNNNQCSWRERKAEKKAKSALKAQSNETDVLGAKKNDEQSTSSSHPKRTVSVIVAPAFKKPIPESKQAGASTLSKTNIEKTDNNTNVYNPQSNTASYKEKEVKSNPKQIDNLRDKSVNIFPSTHPITEESSEKTNSTIVDKQMHPKLARYYKWKLNEDNKNGEHSLKKSAKDIISNTSNNNFSKTTIINPENSDSTGKSKAFQAHLESQQRVLKKCCETIANRPTTSRQSYQIDQETSLLNANNKVNNNAYENYLASTQLTYNNCVSIISEESTSNQTLYSETRIHTSSNSFEKQEAKNRKIKAALHS